MNKTKSVATLLTLLCTILFVSSFALFAGCGNKVKITFNLNYENPTTSIKAIKIEKETCVDDDEDATWPSTVERSGYTFVGWFDNEAGTGTAYLSSTEIDDDVTLYAKWQKNNGSGEAIDPSSGGNGNSQTTQTYTVTFDTQGGSYVPSQTVASGGKAARPSNDPMRIGYTFVKWVTTANGSTEFNFNTPIYAPTVIYAQWKEITADGGQTSQPSTIYTIKFVDADMSDVNSYYESEISMACPVKEGYTFIGWTATGLGADAEVASFETGGYVHWDGSLMKTTGFKHLTSVGNTVTLTAHWTKNS